MNEVFEKLKKISDNYKETVDDISENYDLDGRKDYVYNDTVRVERQQKRNIRFHGEIDAAVQKSVKDAEPLIAKLRTALRKYVVTSSDPTTLATLQSLIAGGVELTDLELGAFADGAGYAVLRLLENHSKGRVHAPELGKLESDAKELESYFRNLTAYRGSMAETSTARPWGQSPVMGNAIEASRINGFGDKLEEMATRWACVFGDNAS